MAAITSLVPEALRWRWWFARRYWFLLRTFRNGLTLVQAQRRQQICAQVVLRDGICLLHPPDRAGFLQTILEIWHEQCYTPESFYQPTNDDVIIDAGANVGLFSIWMARRAPECRIFALEPFAQNFVLLQKNLEAARVRHATSYRLALGGSSGLGYMVPVGQRSLDHQLAGARETQQSEEQVPVVSLQDLLERIGAERIAFLKVDIEGAESAVFSNVDSGLLSRIDHLAIEYHDHLVPGVSRLLAAKLAPTHHLSMHPENSSCGILLGKRRELASGQHVHK